MFSVVLEEKGGEVSRSGAMRAQIRRLPTLHMGVSPIYAHRELLRLQSRLVDMVSMALRSKAQPTYAMQACEVDGLRGLFARDFFNRSVYRRRLVRDGAALSDDPLVTFDGGSFSARDWGKFRPSFLILGGSGEPADEVKFFEGALVPFTLASYRFGPVGAEELRSLVQISRGLIAIGGDDHAAVLAALRET